MSDTTRSDAAFFPDTSGEYREALTLGSNFPHPKERNGKPCHYFWKEALPPTHFQDAKGQSWNITPGDIDQAIAGFKLAREKARFEPPLPASHKDMTGRNYGYVVDARKNDKGSLELLHQFIGDDEKNEALNKKSSIGLLFNQTDAYGNKYPVLIDHNAILPNPVLTDLDDFKPALAASKDQPVRAVVLTLARKAEADMAASPEQVDYVKRECYGGMNADHVDKDNAMDHLIAHHRALKSTHPSFGMRLSKEDAEKLAPTGDQLKLLNLSKEQVDGWKPQPDPKIGELTTQLTAAKSELDRAKASNLELSKSLELAKPRTIDPEVLFERRLRLVETRKDQLVARLGKDHAEKLIVAAIGTENTPNGFMLSRDVDAKDCRAAEIIDIVLTAPITPGTGSRTRAQVLERVQAHDPALQASKDATDEKNQLIERAKELGIPVAAA